MILTFSQMIEEWLGGHKTLWHFYVWESMDRYKYQVQCPCQNSSGWWLAIESDFVYIGTENCDLLNPPKLYATDPELFAKLEDILTKGHLKWKGEFRGRPTQS